MQEVYLDIDPTEIFNWANDINVGYGDITDITITTIDENRTDVTWTTTLDCNDIIDSLTYYFADDGNYVVNNTTTINLFFDVLPSGLSGTTVAHVYVYPDSLCLPSGVEARAYRSNPDVTTYTVNPTMTTYTADYEVFDPATYPSITPDKIEVILLDPNNFFARYILIQL